MSRPSLTSREAILLYTDFSLDDGLAAIERPPCPKCDGQMLFTGMVLGPPGFDLRSFKCNACNYSREGPGRDKYDGLDQFQRIAAAAVAAYRSKTPDT